jgi:hypothetical protein
LAARVTFLVLVFMVLAGSVWAGNSGLCHSVIVSSKVLLPDGSVHGPGTLTSCAERTHSPTSTLLELSFDGHPIHLVISPTSQTEASGEMPDPFFVFHRDRQDRLIFQGYVVPTRSDLLTYGMHRSRANFEVTSSWVAQAMEIDTGAAGDSRAIVITASR